MGREQHAKERRDTLAAFETQPDRKDMSNDCRRTVITAPSIPARRWAVALAHRLAGIDGAVIAGAAAVVGHIFPIWLGFKGGKGVATFFGVMLAAYWPAGLLAIATWLLVAYIWKISSLAALAAAALTPTYAILLGELSYGLLAMALAVIIFITHRENIHRLWRGEEPRIGAKSDA